MQAAIRPSRHTSLNFALAGPGGGGGALAGPGGGGGPFAAGGGGGAGFAPSSAAFSAASPPSSDALFAGTGGGGGALAGPGGGGGPFAAGGGGGAGFAPLDAPLVTFIVNGLPLMGWPSSYTNKENMSGNSSIHSRASRIASQSGGAMHAHGPVLP